MAFNINTFKSEIDKRGGPARPSLFEIIIAPINDGVNELNKDTKINSRTFSFFCSSANIPGISINSIPYLATGALTTQFPIAVINQPVNTVFMVDSDHQILNYFHNWMQKIVNHGSASAGTFDEVDGKLPYEIGYKDEYATDITIRHYSTESFEDKYYEVKLHNAFPVTIADLDLAWENNDSFLTMPVSFVYDKISYSGTKTGTPTSSRSRGTGLLDRLGAVAGFAGVVRQTIEQGVKFDTIQDAVNRISRVRNSFDTISNRI